DDPVVDDPRRERAEPADDEQEQRDDQHGVALVSRDGGVHGGVFPGVGERIRAIRAAQNWTRGGSAMAAESATSKNSRSVKPRPRTKSVLGKILIFVLSSRTPPL